ncbi:MAG: MBL fold metallo-hydrolase [Chloroflexus aggregans]|uniref:MBL fold metallo-hydrolase n=2 Tax=Chloroflexus TaxID=1107 RepID=A0A2J6XB57_9CHLR|nr:MAG: MBL fold metallo-hydrolase [Chloroflexus aggregans]
MRARIWGTRGSYPVAHAHMLRYGGNTTCVEVEAEERRIILDAGTGLRLLGASLQQQHTTLHHIDLLITHTHWDHIIGFPFFAPLFDPNLKLDIYGLARTQSSLRTTLAGALSDPLLPLTMDDLRAQINFFEIGAGHCFELGPVQVRTALANHPYRALAYRLETPDGVLTFIPDTGPFHTVLFGEERIEWTGQPTARSQSDLRALAAMKAAIIELAYESDWLIYDAQFTDAQYARFPHWGHSSASQAREIAEEARVRQLILFHHDPHRTDEELDRIVAEQQAMAAPGLLVTAAFEGMELRRSR